MPADNLTSESASLLDSSTTTSTTAAQTTITQRDGNSPSSDSVAKPENATAPSSRPYKKNLINWDDLPHWQRDNHYIISGYVGETNSLSHSFHSLTYLHNESVNIYSHLVPSITAIVLCLAFITLVTFYSYSLVAHPSPVSTFLLLPDTLAFLIFGLGVATCLGLSATFHTLKSHSHAVATFGNQLDYLGIVVLIVASMISIVNYSFADVPNLRIFFWILTLTLGTACGVVSLHSKFRTADWRPYRAAMFVTFGLSGVFPVIAGFLAFDSEEAWNRSQLVYLLWEATLYISGAVIYAARVPERFNPGKYDIFGHSHQIFHFLVVLAAISHGIGLYKACQYAHHFVLQ